MDREKDRISSYHPGHADRRGESRCRRVLEKTRRQRSPGQRRDLVRFCRIGGRSAPSMHGLSEFKGAKARSLAKAVKGSFVCMREHFQESQRPRLRALALPWDQRKDRHQPQRGCARKWHHARSCATALRLEIFGAIGPKVASPMLGNLGLKSTIPSGLMDEPRFAA